MSLGNLIRNLKYRSYRISIFFYKIFLGIYQANNRLVKKAKQELTENIDGKTYCCVELKSIVNQFKMILIRPGFIEDEIAKFKTWEPRLMSLMCFFMRHDGIFLDVGANIGFHSLFLASSFERSQCIAFEPNPVIYGQLIRNVKINDNLTNISTCDIAVSDHCGEVEFYMQQESSYNRGLSSTLYNYDINYDIQNIEKIRVKTKTIDSFLDDSIKDKIAVIKIDTQGNEYQVICGSINTIKISKPVIFFEFEVGYHSEDPEGYLNKILDILPEYKIFLVSKDASRSFKDFRVSEICKEKYFEGDFICLPHNLVSEMDLKNWTGS